MQIESVDYSSKFNAFIGYCPRFFAYYKHYEKHRDFGSGHLSKIAQIVIDFELKEDVTRILSPDTLVKLDSLLCAIFGNTPNGKLCVMGWFVFNCLTSSIYML